MPNKLQSNDRDSQTNLKYMTFPVTSDHIHYHDKIMPLKKKKTIKETLQLNITICILIGSCVEKSYYKTFGDSKEICMWTIG